MSLSWPLVHEKEGENVWNTYMKNRIFQKNASNNLVVVGVPGIGKSWSSLSYLSSLDDTFDIERCFFHASHVLKAIKETGPNRLKRGSAILYDECGVDLNSQNWQNEICRAMNLVWQTVRFRGLTTCLTLPYTNFLSKSVRTLMTSKFKVVGWNKKTQLTKIKPLTVEYNPDVKDGKFYHKRLLVKTLKGPSLFCDFIEIPAPPKKLRIEYEKMKQEYTDKLYDTIGKRVEEYERKASQPISKIKLSEAQREVLIALKDKKTVPEIAAERSCGVQNIYSILEAMRKKGLDFKAVKNEDKSINHYEVVSGDVL